MKLLDRRRWKRSGRRARKRFRKLRKRAKKILSWATLGERDRLRLRRAGVLTALSQFQAARPTDAFPPDYSDLWFLYREVRARRPSTVLEFGSGCSTVVLAVALSQNDHGHLWTIETDQNWAHSTAAALPETLRAVVTVLHAEAIAEDRDVAGWLHRPLPDVAPDFVYLDGPPLTRERKVAFDVVDLEQRLRPGCVVVVDGRPANVRYLEQRLTRAHSFVKMPPWRAVFEFAK